MQKPQFPTFVFLTAIGKDIVDLITFGLLSIVTSFMFGLVMFFWILSKSKAVQKMYINTFLRKNMGWFALEVSPLGAIPVAWVLVLRAHKQEKKFVRNTAIQQRDAVANSPLIAANDNAMANEYSRAA